MAKINKKFYTTNPNEYMNYLGKKGVIVYPELYGSKFKIEVTDGKKVIVGKNTYTTKTINEGLFEALKYTYNKYKQNEK